MWSITIRHIHRPSYFPSHPNTHLSSILLVRSFSALLLFSFLDSCRSFVTLHSPATAFGVRCRHCPLSVAVSFSATGLPPSIIADCYRLFASYHLNSRQLPTRTLIGPSISTLR
jgi:hypothetical protein